MCSILLFNTIINMAIRGTPKFSSSAELHPRDVQEEGMNFDKLIIR